jgi:hypothetical protein
MLNSGIRPGSTQGALVVKRPECEGPSIVEIIKKLCSSTATPPYVFMALCLIKQRAALPYLSPMLRRMFYGNSGKFIRYRYATVCLCYTGATLRLQIISRQLWFPQPCNIL